MLENGDLRINKFDAESGRYSLCKQPRMVELDKSKLTNCIFSDYNANILQFIHHATWEVLQFCLCEHWIHVVYFRNDHTTCSCCCTPVSINIIISSKFSDKVRYFALYLRIAFALFLEIQNPLHWNSLNLHPDELLSKILIGIS